MNFPASYPSGQDAGMKKHHIALTADEQSALAKINFENRGDHATYLANRKPILLLVGR
jgi:hypothetical protein